MRKMYVFLLLINSLCFSVSGQIKLNVLYSKSGLLYRGVNNRISFDSVACRNVSFSSNDAKLYINSGWIECYPNSLKPVTIVATAKAKDSTKKSEKFTFEVKTLPTTIGLRWGNIHLTDTIKRSHLLLIDRLVPFYSNDLYLPSELKRYTFEAGDFAFNITGNMFTNEVKATIRKLQSGSKINITNIIVASGPSFCDYKIEDIQLVLK